MRKQLKDIVKGYQDFRAKYASGDQSIMHYLAEKGQQPQVMVVACCDSRVDPALILQCDPGDLFVVRNVANIVPPFEKDSGHHGTSAALEFAINFLGIEHLIILGHSQCGGIQALLTREESAPNEFIDNWVSVIKTGKGEHTCVDSFARGALHQSHKNCMTFPWIADKIAKNELEIHRWFFDIQDGQIYAYDEANKNYTPFA